MILNRNNSYIMFLFFLLNFLISTANSENPNLIINDGQLEGTIMRTKGGRAFSAFLGIPYAEPPMGELRFKAPVPIKPWEGILQATKSHPFCPQEDYFSAKIIGEENCLFLNVYTPRLPHESKELLPVLVYIHGGAFIFGAATNENYGPEYLLDKDLILVTPNYRLGALGFLSTNDDVSPGNYGLKDQSLALKWVNKNIKHFGGDPDSVTVGGVSAGGASSHYQLLSPLNTGLFKGVISQSGISLCNWAFNPEEENIENAKKLAEHFGCPTATSLELVECLRNVETKKLVKASEIFVEWAVGATVPFKPTVEPPSPEAFLTDTPANVLKSGNYIDVPVLTGICRDEGLIVASGFPGNPQLFDQLNEDFNNKMALTLAYKHLVSNPDVITEKVRKFYFGNEEKLTLENSFKDLVKVYGDALFGKCLDDTIRAHLRNSKHQVYNYLFTYEGTHSFTEIHSGKKYGVHHGDDMIYLFKVADSIFPKRNETEDDVKVRELLTTYIFNFVETGNPTPTIDNVVKTKWEPVKTDKLEYYHIDSDVQEMRAHLYKERVAFWRRVALQPKKNLVREEL